MSHEPGEPGEFPFTRGVYPDMYRSRLWTMRQYAGFGNADESNRRYRYLLSQGTTGLSLAFDLPTQMGYDSDHPMAAGEVGRVGVAISSLADIERLFQAIALDRVSTSMTINSTAAVLLAFYVLVAERQGTARGKLSGTIQNDILKEYIARGTYIYPPRPAMRIVTDIFAWAGREMPEWNTISISGYHIREAGSTATQELAFTFANAIAYIEAALAAGLPVDSFAPRLSFFFNSHNDFLEEIAKFRAARRIYAHLMRDRFGARDPRSLMLRFHVQTAGSTLTAQQPDVNIVRTALQAMAAVLGGAQSLHTNSRDEALSLPTEESARIALRIQQVVAYESGVTNTADPVGGSDYIEGLTDSIESGVHQYLKTIQDLGGTLRAIETGYITTPPTITSAPSKPASASSSASTAFKRKTSAPPPSSASIPNSKRHRSKAFATSAPAAVPAMSPPNSTPSTAQPAAPATSCPPSSKPPPCTPPSAKSPILSAASSANTAMPDAPPSRAASRTPACVTSAIPERSRLHPLVFPECPLYTLPKLSDRCNSDRL